MIADSATKLLYDIETDGLLDSCTVVHVVAILDLVTGELEAFGPHYEEAPGQPRRSVLAALRLLENAELLVGHNILDYDNRALAKLFPKAVLQAPRCIDTLVLSKMVFPDIKPMDFAMSGRWGLPKHLIGRHSLEAWGHRLGEHKGDYSKVCKEKGIDPWAAFNQDMLDYCVQDVRLNHKLFKMLAAKKPPRDAVDLEMQYKLHAIDMETNGVPFDLKRGVALEAALTQRSHELRKEVEGLFPPWWVALGEHKVTATRKVKRPDLGGEWNVKPKGKTVKADRAALDAEHPPGNWQEAFAWEAEGKAVAWRPCIEHWDEGAVYTKIELRHFNPSSRSHIADRLMTLYGWKPVEFGKDGSPTLDDDMLSEMPFPPCKLLTEFLMVEKRLAALATGKQAWMKAAKERVVHGRKDLRLHGRMDTIGTATGRCAHMSPNMGQVPSVANAEGVVPYGKDCRHLFRAERGMVMVGADASGIQLRALGHNLQPFDGGAYAHVAATGDVHEANRVAANLDTRARAKRFIYAYLFGGGGWKLGTVTGGATEEDIEAVRSGKAPSKRASNHLAFVGLPPTPENVAITLNGFRYKEAFTKKTAGLTDLQKHLDEQFQANKSIVGLDGRAIQCRSAHSTLNYLLQSDEAILCKRWKVLFRQEAAKQGFVSGRDFVMHLDVHDEIQFSALPDLAPDLGKLAERCVTLAGEHYGYRVPLGGEAKIGADWAETH